MIGNSWAYALRDSLQKAEYDLTDEGRAKKILDGLASRVYEAKMDRRDHVKIFKMYGNHSFESLTHEDKLVYEALISEGQKPYVEVVEDRMDGGTDYDCYLAIHV
jgi:hypothetical protein